MTTSGNFFELYINGGFNDINTIENYLLKINTENNKINRAITLIMKNEMNLIVGATGSGKSKIGAFLIRQLIKPECDKMFLRNDDFNSNRLLIIDNEMDDLRIINWYIKTPFYDLDKSELVNLVDRQKKLYGKKLKGTGNEKEMFEIIKDIVVDFKNKFPNENKIVLLDSVYSLTENTNDPNNNKLGNDLNNLLTDTTSILISHTNHKSLNSTSASGSLGTSLERCSSIILNINKVSELETDVIIKKTKSHPEDENCKIRFYQRPILHKGFDDTETEIFIYDSLSIIGNKEKQENINPEVKALELIESVIQKYGEQSNESLRKNIVSMLTREMNKADKTIYKYLENLEQANKISIINGHIQIK